MVEGKNYCLGYGCYGFGSGLTECDGSNSDSVQVGLRVGSDKKPGLGLAVDSVSLKPRVTKMEGKDNKSGSKKRSKPAQIGFNSDDNEPIGSLFKLISKKNPKKAKAVSGVVGEKGQDAEVCSEKLLAVDEDLGGMDDTLASFKKKLRAPKKDAGSGITVGRSAESLNGPVKGSVIALETKVVGNSEVVTEDGFGGRIDQELDDTSKEKIKDFKGALKPPKSRGYKGSHEASDGQGYGNNSIQNEKECNLGLNKGPGAFLDDNFEDSLSESFRKAKSELTKKSHGYLRSRQRRETRAPGNELNFDDVSGSEDLLPVVRRRSQSASNLDQKILDCDNSLHQASSRDPMDSTHSPDKIGMPQTMCNNAMSEISSTTGITEMKVRSSDGMQRGHPEAILEDSVPISFFQRSRSSLSACSRKTEGLKEGDVDSKIGTSLDNHVLDDGELVELHSTKLKERCSLHSQELTLENQDSEGGFRAIDLAHVAGEMPNLISVPTKTEEIHQFDAGVSNLGFNSAASQHSKGLPTNFILSRDQKTCFSGKEVQKACFDDDSLDRQCEDASQDIDSISLKKEDVRISQSNLSPLISCGVHTFDSAVPMKHQGKSSENVDNLCHLSPELVHSEFVTSGQIYCSTVHEHQHSDDVPQYTFMPNQGYLSGSGEVNGSSSPSTTPDRNESCAPGKGHLHDLKFKNKKQLVGQRVPRKTRKRRHGDMAYEGDADWEMLIHEQGFLDNCLAGDEDQSFKVREKFRSASNVVIEAENGGMAAVSAGLKARAVGPVEKIKFKDVLKRKGGLQEYLQCRNKILGLWSKDVTRVLPLTECGVTASPSVDEPPQASLIREIYAFLDQSGYINVGVASEKDRTDSSAMHNFKLLKGKNFGEKSGVHDADTDDGVSFILGRERSSELCMVQENGDTVGVQNQSAGVTKDGKADSLHAMELSTFTGRDECRADELHENASIDTKSHDGEVNLNVLNSNISSTVLGSTEVSVINSDPRKHINDVQSASSDSTEENHGLQSDPESRKKVIVIGAGPAGLTAARHLQRQGFLVTVLEGRSRIGGRVYTDSSSLSVPVDLGASIITGVEADVATERRPDPSSLVCAQLGLELTVLNSDCPLYDTVTGHKVPADLDEALEAEYNTLLDDMLLLVAQKGEKAMKMSLEEGLEYALKRRRMARLGRNYVESGLRNISEALLASGKEIGDDEVSDDISSVEEILSPLERRVMNWHYAHLEYGCAALLKEVSLPYWNQDDIYGGFGGAHCMIKGGYSTVIESLGEGLCIHLNHVVTDIKYCRKEFRGKDDWSNVVKVLTSNGREFSGDAVLITVPLGCLKAEAIKFSPPLPQWKRLSIQRLGFGVLNKVVLEFPEVFWDDSVDYFGATAEETNQRGQCFMFWNVKKTVGAPVLIALVVGKAAIDGQNMSASYHVNHALTVLRKLFGEAAVPNPVASVVTDWGKDPFSYGSYSYVAVGASGEDYDILGRPVENCLFFAGEATCKEHPDTVGGAMMSGLREAVRIIDILNTGNDYTAEVEAMEAARQHSDNERNEVRDIVKRLEAVEISNVLYKKSLDGAEILTREALLQDMFAHAKTTDGRLHLAKELLKLPVEVLKSFAGTKNGLSTLNSWMLDSMGKDGTQLLRHCVRLLVLVSTDLLAVRMSGIGKTVKEKVCVHTSRDIRAIASQLVNMWIEVFRKGKASNGGLNLLRQSTAGDSLKSKSLVSGKPPLRMHHALPDNKGSSQAPASGRNHLPPSANVKRISKSVKLETRTESKLEAKSSMSQGSVGREGAKAVEDYNYVMSEEEQAAYAVAEAARAAALAAAEAYASSEAQCNTSLPLPKIMSFHKFLRREQYTQMDESDIRRKWSGGALGRQDCISEIDSRNCRVRDWSLDFSAACVNLDNSKMSVDNLSQLSLSNDPANQLNLREQSAESAAVDSSIFTKAWVDADGGNGVKDNNAIDRWQSQAAAADSDFFHRTMQIRDEEDSNMSFKQPSRKPEHLPNESSVSQVTINKELVANQPRGPERIKQAVVDYVASLLMPLYKAKKIDKEGYKSIMKKTATKVMEQTTDAEKAMAIYEFLDFKRKNKIRAFVDKLIERHMATKPDVKP